MTSYAFKDCDADGFRDHVCSDTQAGVARYGVVASSTYCQSTWPNGRDGDGDCRNSGPTGLELVGGAEGVIAENAVGVTVGLLVVTDPDMVDRHTFRIVQGGEHLAVNGSRIITTAPGLDFEMVGSTLTITVVAEDQQQFNLTKQFNLTVRDVDEPVTKINITANTLHELATPPVLIGEVSAVDPDPGDQHTLQLLQPGAGYRLEGQKLYYVGGNSAVQPNYEEADVVKVGVRATNQNGVSTDLNLTLVVLDNNDPPFLLTTAITVDENAQIGSVVAEIQVRLVVSSTGW